MLRAGDGSKSIRVGTASEAEATKLTRDAAALDFVTDAFAHCKFIGYVQDAMPLLEKANVAGMMDEGVVAIVDDQFLQRFLSTCRELRLWQRELRVKMGN